MPFGVGVVVGESMQQDRIEGDVTEGSLIWSQTDEVPVLEPPLSV